MGPAWAYAFLAAGFVTLLGTPVLRRLALATDFVDHPITAAHKSHDRPTPYLGGVGLIVAVLIGLLFANRLTAQVGVIALGGSLIGCVGLLDDHRSVGPLFRFLVEMGVAAVALAAGLRVHATDIPAIDGIVTLVWIVGVTNAVNLLDNMDGLAAGVSAAAALAIFCLAILGEQLVTATVAAGLVGACAGFLVYNRRPASIFMGDTGSLFLGFVLALSAIEVSPALTPPTSFAVPVMLLALPVLDTATVVVARLRRGRPVSEGGKDHLSHRLVASGLSPGAAVGVLVATEAAVGLAAVLAGRDVVPLGAAVLWSAVALTALALVTARAAVYVEPVTGIPHRLRIAAAGGVVGLAVLAAPAVVALGRARGPGLKGSIEAHDGLAALQAGQAARARTLFDHAATHLQNADGILRGGGSSLGLLLPGLRANLATTRALVAAGRNVSRAAADVSAVVDARSLTLHDPSSAAAASASLAPALADSASVLQASLARLAGYDRPYLWPSLRTTVREFRDDLEKVSIETSTAADISRFVPVLFGSEAPRHYFLAVEDNSELRGAGGVVRYWGEITADQGGLRLSRFGSVDELNAAGSARTLSGPAEFLARYRQFDPANTWQNVNVSPDFRVTGEVVANLYPQSGGRDVDGVIAVDLPGLAAVVDVAGPLRVDGWPNPVTGADLADVLLRQVPARFSDPAQRQTVVSSLLRRALETVLAADLQSPVRLARALGPAVRDGHLLLYAQGREEEQFFERLGAAGDVPSVTGDSLFVVNQNLTATPVDAQLRRRVNYDVHLDPDRDPAQLSARIEIGLTNQASAENRTYMSVYSPFSLEDARPGVAVATELGRHAYSADLTVPPGQSREVTLDVTGALALDGAQWYRLALPHQASLTADEVHVSLSVPSGWRLAEVHGPVQRLDARHAVALLQASGSEDLSVRLERTTWSRIWARIRS